jgi:hypothetical protein
VIDGRPQDPAWVAAPWTNLFQDIEGDRQPQPRFETRAKMLWDEEYFYITAEMEEPHLWATLKERDSVIYYDNDFEVFIDPDGDSHLYTEIEVNAFNTVWDLLLIKPYRDGGPAIHAWDIPGLKTAVHLNGTLNDPSDQDVGWSIEIAIPFAVLAETTDSACPPLDGDQWRVNFSRVQWHLENDSGAYTKVLNTESKKSLPEDNWTWSAQREIAMHEPEHWGIVEFRNELSENVISARDVDAAAWHLRLISYALAAHRSEAGSYPQQMPQTATASGAPEVGQDWQWPPHYWSDGLRYTLTLDLGTERIRLNDDGRLQRLPGD